MNNLAIKGNVKVVDVKVPNIHGGFGEGKKAMLAKHIAEIHEKKLIHVNEIINENRHRFKDNVDIIDVKTNEEFVIALTDNNIFTKMQIGKANNIYLLSERGYAKLIKIFNDDKSWDLYDQLLDEYFDLRDENVIPMKPMTQLELAQYSMNLLIEQERKMNEVKIKQEEHDNEIKLLQNKQKEQEDKVVQILDYATLVPDFKTIQNAINKYARLSGETQLQVRAAIYRKISDVHGIDFNKRVNNKHKKIQNERNKEGKKPYTDNTLKQKYSKMDVIKEEKLEKEVIQILMDMTDDLNMKKEILSEIENDDVDKWFN